MVSSNGMVFLRSASWSPLKTIAIDAKLTRMFPLWMKGMEELEERGRSRAKHPA